MILLKTLCQPFLFLTIRSYGSSRTPRCRLAYKIRRTGFSREGGRSDDATAANVPASSRLKPVLLDVFNFINHPRQTLRQFRCLGLAAHVGKTHQ
jgi:hypothetical protein